MSFDIDIVFRVLLAALIGGLIGFDRQKQHKPAGLRTHILVCIGSALFAILSYHAFPEEPSRIAANIVVGIGFLGAGTIFRFQHHVQGLTTAASLWATAGVGMAVGLGYIWEAFAVAVIIFIVLELSRFEEMV